MLARFELAPAAALDELAERPHDLRGRLLRQVKQGRRRSIGRYRVLMQAATIRRGRRRRWLLLSDTWRRHESSDETTALLLKGEFCRPPPQARLLGVSPIRLVRSLRRAMGGWWPRAECRR